MCRGRGGAEMTASARGPAPLLQTTAAVTAGFRLIQRGCCTVSIRISFLVVKNVRRRAWRSNRVKHFCRDPVFYCYSLLINCLSQPIKPFFHLSVINGTSLHLVIIKFGYRDGKGWGINHPCRDHVNGPKQSYTLMYSLRYCRTKGSSPERLSERPVDHRL